jgi:hypothetical protein
MSTTVPSIPAPTPDNLLQVNRAIKSVLDVREGLVGDPLDANVTFRDLIDTGALALRPGWTARSSVSPVIPSWTDPDGYDGTTDMAAPMVPSALVVTSGIALIKLRWADPAYRNHSYTEIWRSETNVIGNSILIGTSDTQYYVDSLGQTGVTYYYWIRFISESNQVGPYNAVDGTTATPGLIDNADIANLDAAKITTGFLSANRIQAGTLDAKIANIDAAVITSGTLNVARIGDATLGFAKIANDIQSTNYVAGSTGWKIDKTGQMEMNNATFRGTIDVKSSTSGARLEITNNVIRVYDSDGVLRVKIGNLNA